MSKYVKAITWDFIFENRYELYIPKKKLNHIQSYKCNYDLYKKVKRKSYPRKDAVVTKDICTLMQSGYTYKDACKYCIPYLYPKSFLQSKQMCEYFIAESKQNNERVGDTIMNFVKTFEKILNADYQLDDADKVRLKEFSPELGEKPTKTDVLVSNYIENTINKPNVKDIEMIMRIVGEGDVFSTKEKIEVSNTTNSVIKMLEDTKWEEPEDIKTPNDE